MLPSKPRNPSGFMLTPLVDIMFLMLIFFMLSFDTGHYFHLPLAARTQAGGEPAVAPVRQVVITVGNGFARVNGTRVALEALGAAITRATGSGRVGAVVTAAKAATAQDLVSALEALKVEAVESVRLVAPARDLP